MVDLEKLSFLVQDEENRLRYTFIKKGLNYHIYIEKLHSLNQWINIYLKEFSMYNSKTILKGGIDEDSILVMNYLSLCNGIVDTYDGFKRIMNDMQSEKYELKTNSFKKCRRNNTEHDKFFGYEKYSDFQYFKHIRAIFGQHPSNLEYKDNGDSKRAFSSWPFHDSILQKTGCDLYTNVYFDLSKQGWGIRFHLFLDEVESFTNQVLKSIDFMIGKIIDIVESYISDSCPGEIIGFNGISIEKKLKTLQSEISKRYSFDDYHYLLDATIVLERMLKHNSIENFESETTYFLEDIDRSLDEIHSIVSTCSNEELFLFNDFYSGIMGSIGHHYYREKCALYILGDLRYMDIYQLVCKDISKIFKVDISHEFGDFYYRLYILYRSQKRVYA